VRGNKPEGLTKNRVGSALLALDVLETAFGLPSGVSPKRRNHDIMLFPANVHVKDNR
jgi:hypothetical protein